MNLNGQNIATSETQAGGAAYGDLATPGPSVTLTLTGTTAIVWMSAQASHDAGNTGFISVEVSGASTVPASDANAVLTASYSGAIYTLGLARVLVLTGLTPGVNTFTLKYHNDGGAAWTFWYRSIAVYAP